jgi:ferric-dicitrate binding protein FerR (iron transport regulator)
MPHDRRFAFDHTPLQRAAEMFSSAHGKRIVFLDPGAEDVPMTGEICSSDFDSFVSILRVFYQLEETPERVRVGVRINPRGQSSPK